MKVQFFLYLHVYPRFQASGLLPRLHRTVCKDFSWKPGRPVFSSRGSYGLPHRPRASPEQILCNI